MKLFAPGESSCEGAQKDRIGIAVGVWSSDGQLRLHAPALDGELDLEGEGVFGSEVRIEIDLEGCGVAGEDEPAEEIKGRYAGCEAAALDLLSDDHKVPEITVALAERIGDAVLVAKEA
ncbi:hypothetical protein [Parvularcula maris]|uniref:Uncharacterized protein n=1 Tax=Parvularcula maris TaxID=2965077 RepID=A0A9X2LBG0_9PROT|nr:hypothetical protein [Parvularcula maris]MCQ8186653.1 hypothetical protein [Parvularcula maris]